MSGTQAPERPTLAGEFFEPAHTNHRRRWRWPAVVAGAVLLTVLAGLLLLRPGSSGRLAPDNPGPQGTRALAHILREHGVDVRLRNTFDEVRADLHESAGSATVMLARPDLLGVGRGFDLAELVRGASADLVVVGAGNGLLSDLELGVGAAPVDGDDVRNPDCSAAVPQRAGDALTGSMSYSANTTGLGGSVVDSKETACYPVNGRGTYLQVDHPDGRRTVLLGSGATLTNDRLADAGDAALAIGTLGHNPVLIWWTPNPLDSAIADQEPPTLGELLPSGVRFAALQLLVVLLVVVLWRGRRIGRLVAEPLPVVVRAVETTRARAQLYRRARARGRAAQVLRTAAVRRLAVRCGLPSTAAVAQVVAAVAAATDRPSGQVAALLVGRDPTDDKALILLARELETLEMEVHRP